MNDHAASSDPSTWDPALDAVVAAPKHHRVLFENENLRVIEVTLEHEDEEPVHHHRWPSVFVFDQVGGPVHDIAPDGTQLPPGDYVVRIWAADVNGNVATANRDLAVTVVHGDNGDNGGNGSTTEQQSNGGRTVKIN